MHKRGYVGLISILVSVALMALLFTYMYLKPHPDVADNPSDQEMQSAQQALPETATATTQMDQLHGDINAAGDVQGKANLYNDSINKAMME